MLNSRQRQTLLKAGAENFHVLSFLRRSYATNLRWQFGKCEPCTILKNKQKMMVFVPSLVTLSMISELPPHIVDAVSNLSLSICQDSAGVPEQGWCLCFDESGLSLIEPKSKAPASLRIDFVDGKLGFRRRRQEAKPEIIKALGIQGKIKPLVWDQTAGLGQDAFIIAQYAGSVSMFERNPVVNSLLQDGLHRAEKAALADEGLQSIISKMHLLSTHIESIDESPDIVYLDPMFPMRRKSAKVKKGMQIFHQLVGDDADADEMLELALERTKYRVVVKRPVGAPELNNQPPNFVIKGKTIRFDVYSKAKMPDHLDRTK